MFNLPGELPGCTLPALVIVGVIVPVPLTTPPLIVMAAPVPVDVRLPLTVVVPPVCVYGPLFIDSVEPVSTVTAPALLNGFTASDLPPVTTRTALALLSLNPAIALVDVLESLIADDAPLNVIDALL